MATYKRVLLKLSGEALSGDKGSGLDIPTIENICKSIKKCADAGAQIGIVVGGGNFWRGRSSEGMDRARADHIGMLATAMNALAVADVLEKLGCEVVIFGCGTGNPFFSTDSAASLRAAELNADILLKATMVDGIYDKDPKKFPDAVKYDVITHHDILVNKLQVMDSAAAAICTENNIPIIVFDLNRPDNIYDAVMGETVGTLVTKHKPQ